jgi:acyl carrier protein
VTAGEIRRTVIAALTEVAPEVEPDSIRADVDLREQLDIDSMDFLNFVIALHERLGVDVPERDYPQLATLDGCVDYLAAAVRASPLLERPGTPLPDELRDGAA